MAFRIKHGEFEVYCDTAEEVRQLVAMPKPSRFGTVEQVLYDQLLEAIDSCEIVMNTGGVVDGWGRVEEVREAIRNREAERHLE